MILRNFWNSDCLKLSILCYTFALLCTASFVRLCLLQAALPEHDSISKISFDVFFYGSLIISGIFGGYYFHDRHLNPDRHLIKPKHSSWQALFLSAGTDQSRELLVNKFLQLSSKRQHRFWFEVLLSTTQYLYIMDKEERSRIVCNDLECKGVKIRSVETFKRISKTLRYQELEAKLPHYILLAADSGDELAKDLRRYLPMKTRFFWKKDKLFLNS